MYQLPPIYKRTVFDDFKNDVFNLYHPWHLFTMIELVDIMRQKDDQPFAELLNRFRTASQTEEDIQCNQSRAIDPSLITTPQMLFTFGLKVVLPINIMTLNLNKYLHLYFI